METLCFVGIGARGNSEMFGEELAVRKGGITLSLLLSAHGYERTDPLRDHETMSAAMRQHNFQVIEIP